MFDITGDDIARLPDADLRTLVARLALAELAMQQLPLASVTAGGNQDAKDGGIDVRVDVKRTLVSPDFVPREKTGFQVKKPDMGAASIAKEMRPNGRLRQVIGALADEGGAYIIVSAQGSLTDTALKARRKAMRDALEGHPNAGKLHTDFYDRDRLANWVNAFPGAAAWVRSRIGGVISGWQPVGRWAGINIAADGGYLVSDAACVIDERSRDLKRLTIPDALDRLRTLLASPRQIIRLIGMSGLGKTRLVQALFEPGIGSVQPLDPALSVYTDYSDDIAPSAREMARRLVNSGRQAILVVDNCNPATHGELATICSSDDSKLSLLTIEYDVRDDEPELTDVFRLTSASSAVLEQWLERDFPHVSQVDRERIAEFSNGNFRVARALADTLRRGETLAQLRNQDLFERIFVQRNAPDGQLLRDAETLALVYSFDGESEGPDAELSILADFAARPPRDLFAAVAELHGRGVIQSRGRWRAVLPQAVANRLAVAALTRIPAGELDRFCAGLPPRLLKSFTRRLGYLHESNVAQATVARWLRPDGALGDLFALAETGFEIIRNIAPVSPIDILAKVESEIDGERGDAILAPSNPLEFEWISLLKSLAYDPDLFERAARLLARFYAAECAKGENNSAAGSIQELFHLYLSGTAASPAQRRNVARDLYRENDPHLRRAGALALDSLLEVGHFSSASSFDFGARPRDFGWQPKINRDISDWYSEGIALAVELAELSSEAKTILARNVRELWYYAACRDALDAASVRFADKGWIEGWINFRAALRYDGNGMPEAIRARLNGIIERLKPVDLIDQARAFVLSRNSGGYDVADGEDEDPMAAWTKASQAAKDVGKAMAVDQALAMQFVPEVIACNPPERSYEFGCGLAQGAVDLAEMWADLTSAYRAAPSDARNATLLGGFIGEASRIDANFAGSVIEAAMSDPDLRRQLPFLQAQVALDEIGLGRLRRAAATGALQAADFSTLACGVVRDTPPDAFIEVLEALSELPGGVGVALDILNMRLHPDGKKTSQISDILLAFGRELLKRADFSNVHVMRDYALRTIVLMCLGGQSSLEDARIVCQNIRMALEGARVYTRDVHHLLKSLFVTQPIVALDCFLLDDVPHRNHHLFEFGFSRQSPVEFVDAATLCVWADRHPQDRYPRLGQALSIYATKDQEDASGLSPLFLEVMAKAPDKRRFLGEGPGRLRPSGWSGSLAAILEKRKSILADLADYPDANIRAWYAVQVDMLDNWIAVERERENSQEEAFE